MLLLWRKHSIPLAMRMMLAIALVISTFSSFTIANLYPDSLHLVEASYPWEWINAA